MPSSPSTDSTTVTTSDGVSLFARWWLPENVSRATILIVHGYAEHCGRYEEMAEFLRSDGFAVYAFDQRGAGRSAGRRGEIRSMDTLASDLEDVLMELRPAGPLVLFGHSAGCLVALRHVFRSQATNVDALILSSPALSLESGFPAPLEGMLLRAAEVLPGIPTKPLDRSGLSRDPAVVEDAESDPLNYMKRIRLGTGAAMIRAGSELLERAGDLHYPLYIFVGTADPIARPAGGYALYSRAGSEDKTLAIYEGLKHETFHEPERMHVMDGIRLWLAEHY